MTDVVESPAIYGSQAELLDRLRECLVFARLTVERADASHPVWKVDLGQVSGFEKMMMEAGLLAYIVDRTPYFEKEIRDLMRAIREKYDSTSAVSCILRHPRLAASLGALLLVLDHFGLATAQELAAVRGAFESPYVECSEHVPFRLLDRRWVQGLATGFAEPLEAALDLSTACRATHPIYMTREDGYAITHTAMYATDFGAQPAPAVLQGAALWDTIDAAIAWCTASGDFDLLAELLLSQLYLRSRLSAYGLIAWRQCRETWDSLGFLPSPSLSATSFQALREESERRQYAFHNMYHTMLVGGLLCAALLDMRPPGSDRDGGEIAYAQSPSAKRAIAGAMQHLEQVFGIDRCAAQSAIAAVAWRADDRALDEMVERWSHADTPVAINRQMAIDASIILAAQEYDLPQLAGALRRAGVYGIVTASVEAGIDFLARQSLVSGAIGANWLDGISADTLASARVTAALANCLVDLDERLSAIRMMADAR